MSILAVFLCSAIGFAVGVHLFFTGWSCARMHDWKIVEDAMNEWRRQNSVDLDKLLTLIFGNLRGRRWPWSR